jgi:hypothetical protein
VAAHICSIKFSDSLRPGIAPSAICTAAYVRSTVRPCLLSRLASWISRADSETGDPTVLVLSIVTGEPRILVLSVVHSLSQ